MRISERQVMDLYIILSDTLTYTNANFGGMDSSERRKLRNEIRAQQDNTLKEIDSLHKISDDPNN